MNKYENAILTLQKTKKCQFKAFGNSMTPILYSGVLLFLEQSNNYEIDDIVFCRVHGRYIDAHKIIAKDINKGYLIANNHGRQNGWTHTIYAKVVSHSYV